MLRSAANIFGYILTVFTSLIHLILYESSYKNCVRLNFDDPLLNFRSSILRQLKIRVQSFQDCLCLLDGRFNELHTLCVDSVNIHCPSEIQNQVSFTRKTFYVVK